MAENATIRKIVAGVVGGSLGGAVSAGAYGLLGTLGGSKLLEADALPADAAFVLSAIVIGVGYGLIAGQLFGLLPKSHLARFGVLFLVAAGGELLIGYPVAGLGIAGLGAGDAIGLVVVLTSMALYALVLTFVLRQVLDLPLYLWPPLRRSDEFKDIRAELH